MNRLARAVATRATANPIGLRCASTTPVLKRNLTIRRHDSFEHRRPEQRSKYDVFKAIALSRLKSVLARLQSPNSSLMGSANLSEQKLEEETKLFGRMVEKACEKGNRGITDKVENPLFWSLRQAFIQRDLKGLSIEIQYQLQSFLMRSRFSKSVMLAQKKLADMRFPFEWFPATRALKRTVHLHVGPTNSGKTYNALKALEEAKSGLYAGPLRLLAHEIYTRLNAKGKTCALVTGEEQRIPDVDRYYVSCTVEMTPLNKLVDVAVIDEIQMMADPERGSSWTQAVLGVQAKELHLCGEERTVELIQSLCRSMGDDCIVHRYQRLSPLRTMDRPIGRNFKNLQKGDAIVAFSRVGIHALRSAIEKATDRRCAVVYGSLPPETRAQQAALFNDPDNDYDFIVASDAIGMGLNLEIKRIVFETATKHDGNQFRRLTVPELKQIGGRAGRFRTARDDMAEDQGDPSDSAGKLGLVTCMETIDLPLIQKAFQTQPKQLTKCSLAPPFHIIERFSAYFPPGTPFSFILLRLLEFGTVSTRFELSIGPDLLETADAIEEFPLSLQDRCTLINAPTSMRDYGMKEVTQALARCISQREGGNLLDIKEINIEFLEVEAQNFSGTSAQYLNRLEALHKAIVLYLWVSYRFPDIFLSQNLAFHVRDLVQTKIEKHLAEINITEELMAERRKIQRQIAKKRQKVQEQLLQGEGQPDIPTAGEGAGRWNEEGHEEPLIESPEQLKDVDLASGKEVLGEGVTGDRSSTES